MKKISEYKQTTSEHKKLRLKRIQRGPSPSPSPSTPDKLVTY
jgi:hypothetical protein